MDENPRESWCAVLNCHNCRNMGFQLFSFLKDEGRRFPVVVRTVKGRVVILAIVVGLAFALSTHYNILSISSRGRVPMPITRLNLSTQLTDSASTSQHHITPKPMPLSPNVTIPHTSLPSDTLPPILPETAPEEEILEQIQSYTNKLPDTTEVSVVTAYFDLGSLNKRSAQGRYTPALYKKWMSTFAMLDNPLVVFADTEDTANYFRKLRAGYPPSRTTVILLQRKELWSFRLADEIKKVYSQKNYPRHPPNTINELYSCAMHAKFELMQKVLRERLYQTRFLAWLDIGLFRNEVNKNKMIHLTVPTDFNRTRVGYSQVNKFETLTPADIIRLNKVWVGGASFLACPDVMYIYCSDYRRAVRKLLDRKWMSTDQQVIYSMHQPSFNFTRRFELQAYTRHINDIWFSMGYLMKEAP